jgi:hypothetical protein
MIKFLSVLDVPERALSHERQRLLWEATIGCQAAFLAAGGRPTPKLHAWTHLTQGMVRHGSAKHYACFVDESMNGLLKSIARRVHQRTFARTVFRRILSGTPTTRPS